MAKKEVPLDHLRHYLPEGTEQIVLQLLHLHKVHLTIARERRTLLGDYRHRTHSENHRISVNGNLNKYSFLITLLHELAHLLTYEKFGPRVPAHGQQWKTVFGELLKHIIQLNILPADIETAVRASLTNPAASSCADEHLIRALRKHDSVANGIHLLEELPTGSKFKIKGERYFLKGEKQRKRYMCKEIATNKLYLFSPVYEVEIVED
jgi:predicted SprT family Zn-dependent metalloprotease